ncbi:hypothetical protein P7C70_g3043, partial [Phenoliferia sp. Uapishka_3]
MSDSPAFHTASLTSNTLSYIDSFSTLPTPPTSYTTVIGLHGIGFNSAAWTPIVDELALDPTTPIRFIAYNQRDYRGSSPKVAAELPGAVDVTEVYLNDLLEFIEFVVKELKVPGVPSSGSSAAGGITLLVSAFFFNFSPTRR